SVVMTSAATSRQSEMKDFPARTGKPLPAYQEALLAAWAAVQSAWVFCMVKPWPLHEFWPLHELVACLHAPWPLQDDEFMHLTLAVSPAPLGEATAADIEDTANRPATIMAMAAPLSLLVFMSNS
ncbi:MAG TPA: hypothetical protein VGG00_03335, partial [Rhodanobacter sp.]